MKENRFSKCGGISPFAKFLRRRTEGGRIPFPSDRIGGEGMAGRRARMRLAATAIVAVLSLAPTTWAADSAVVFMYHRFGETAIPSTNVTIAQFEAHLRELKDGPYTVLPLGEIVEAVRARRPLPDRTIGLSVDDAYLSAYKEAWPRLRRAGFPWTLFVATEPVDNRTRGYLTWDQIRELAASGVTIGGHSATHPHMAGGEAARNEAELARSDARLRAELGRPADLFAYPYGEASLALAARVREKGYTAAFGQHSGVIGPTSESFYLPRFALNETYATLSRFRLAANALPLPVSGVTPADPLISDNNPPAVGFTVGAAVGDPARIACFASHQGPARIERLGARRLEVRLKKPFPQGRGRINCTVPAGDGRWRWFGRQYFVP